ncbi:MAG: hypothetical protein ACI8S6_003006 [Myxococcota bacterium]|jgi:hypothetical protein
MTGHPWHAWLILLWPPRVATGLQRAVDAGLIETPPTLWQAELGVLRMWHRLLFRSDTIGTSTHSPRASWRARLLAWRPLRFPFLLWEHAVAPWDMSGLLSSHDRIRCHLLGAHHDGLQFVYDFQLLALAPGTLEAVRDEAADIAAGNDARSVWLKDLTVFEGYHDQLVAAADAFAAGTPIAQEAAVDPDITFVAWLRWCARQPPTPSATLAAWRRGVFSLQHGLQR